MLRLDVNRVAESMEGGLVEHGRHEGEPCIPDQCAFVQERRDLETLFPLKVTHVVEVQIQRDFLQIMLGFSPMVAGQIVQT